MRAPLALALGLGLALALVAMPAAAAPALRPPVRSPLAEGRARTAAHRALRAEQGVVDEFAAPPLGAALQTLWFPAQVDHFNFASGAANNTFQMRYLVDWSHYQTGGAIFFYTGNEGPVDEFAANTGAMYDLAPEFGAVLVFAEHRYYGESLPFGADSFSNENLQYLTTEQALADYALLLQSFKANNTIVTAPVVSFGGSYGGMLTAWFRIKYPHLTVGGVAASAPLLMYPRLEDGSTYARIASRTFAEASQECHDGIAASWDAMTQLASTENGLQQLSDVLRLCQPLTSVEQLQNEVFPWIANAWLTLPMGDYPYPTTFLGPLPGNPVNYSCTFISGGATGIKLVEQVYAAINVYYNYTGAGGQCNTPSAGGGGASVTAGDSWSYQTCTEQVLPQGQLGLPNDMFYVAPWNLDDWFRQCAEVFGVVPRPDWMLNQFGDLQGFAFDSNIVFSNGNRDPWSGGGVLEPVSESVIYNPVQGGAHHYDLRGNNALDTPGVLAAREITRQHIQSWIDNVPTLPKSGTRKIVLTE